jgi:2-polyprenyl-3-methyl-5-hydroxy-6-metoxy-1,4-benzoquinol methylase
MNSLSQAATLLQLFGEPTRVRLMALLAIEELTVAELTAITDLGQSTVSTHLGKLREAGLLRDRRAGASTFYTANDGTMPSSAKKLWVCVREEIDDGQLSADRERCVSVLRARAKDDAWPAPLAGEMERHYSPGRTWESLAHGLAGLLRLGDVLDAGCGDGSIAEVLAPRAKSVTCVDASEPMIQAATRRLARFEHARFEVADVEHLPQARPAFDQALLLNVLVHVASPAKAIAECARVLRRGGSLVVSSLDAHDHLAMTASYGHRHPGVSSTQLKRFLQKAGLVVDYCDVTSREKRPPQFRIVTAVATKEAS